MANNDKQLKMLNSWDISDFGGNLEEFCEEVRGKILNHCEIKGGRPEVLQNGA